MMNTVSPQTPWMTSPVKSEPSETAEAKRRSYASLGDAILIQLSLQRDSDATDALIRRYTPLLLGFLRARIPGSYEDVYQETFARALAKLDTLRRRDRFGPWLLKIARRALVDWVRADSRRAAMRDREEVAGAVHGWPAADRDAARREANSESAQAIIDSILALPENYGMVVYLNLIHEKSPQTIAQELGLRPGTVRMRLKRGLARLRKTLERKGLE